MSIIRKFPFVICTIGIFLLMTLSLGLAWAKPKCDNPPCKDDGEGGNPTYDFKVIFEGDNPLLLGNDNGVPWALSSVVGGHGNIGPAPVGPIPIYVDEIIEIGDYDQPCDVVTPESCSARLGGENLLKDQLTFRNNVDDPILGNVHVYNGFFWLDPEDMTQYHIGVKVYGWADLAAHPWDPRDPEFCVPMEFSHVWIMQSSPIISKRHKQCRDSEYFAVCEADVNEGQFPWDPGTYRATIWRADHPEYVGGLTPPCGFDP